MGLDLTYSDGQTPLDEEEKEGLIIPTISTRGELNEFEQLNIEEAIQWSLRGSFTLSRLLSETFVKSLHKRMYGKVWKWAGVYRQSNKNIGVDKWQIATALKTLLDDTHFWIDQETYAPDEIAIRFKHRLVSIHCFPNGNGRHSRLMADMLIKSIFKLPVFTWGSADLVEQPDPRKAYLKSLKAADQGNVEPLIRFARS